MSSSADPLVSAMMEQLALKAVTEICERLRVTPEPEPKEELLAVVRRLCADLLQELRRLEEEGGASWRPCSSSAAKGDAQVELNDQSDAPTGETSQSEKTPSAGRGRSFSCSVCGSSFSRQTNLSAHLRVHSGERPFACSTCGKAFSARSSVRIHQLTVHGGQRAHRCSHCGKLFATRSHLRTHQASGLRRPLTCSACGKTLAARCCLRGHRLSCQRTDEAFRCAECGKEFSKLSYLTAHRRVHLQIKPFTCPTCHKGFTTRRNVHVHTLTVHRGLRPFTCSVCRKTFSQRSGLTAHLRTHSGERPHTCEQCGNSFSCRSSLTVHRRVHTGEKAFSCDTCGKSFSVSANLRRHRLVHTGRRAFACGVCDRRFTQAAHLKAHHGVHSGEWAFICNACGKGFRQSAALQAHERSHAGVKPFGCSECGKTFSSSSSLKRHQLTHGGRNAHNCNVCGKSFSSAHGLKTHLQLHGATKTFSCDVCGRGYSSPSYLKTHRRSHSEGKPFSCARCQKTFSTQASAKLHERTHSGEKPYVCEVCGKSFSVSQNLVRHKRVHSGEKPFECGVCGRSFSQKNNLKMHQLVHSGLKPFSCSACRRCFTSTRSLREHRTYSGKVFQVTLLSLGGFLLLPLLVIILIIESPIQPEVFSLKEPPVMKGCWESNLKLREAQRLFEDQIHGPESIANIGDVLFAGTADGKIVKLIGRRIHTVTRLGKTPCGSRDEESTCGRPLGIRVGPNGTLFVADAYLGLFEVNPTTGEAIRLVSGGQVVAGRKLSFINDLAVTQDGKKVYFTDSSSRWQRRDYMHLIMEATADGRVLEYDTETRELTVVMENLRFPNGIQLLPDEESVLVAETTMARIRRVHVAGLNKGGMDTFIDNLPGFPDNIRPSSSGGYWVAMSAVRPNPGFSMLDFLSQRPWIKKLIFKIFSQDILMKFVPRYSLVAELHDGGVCTRSLHDPNGLVAAYVSEAHEYDGNLYLGSFRSPYIAKVDLRKV